MRPLIAGVFISALAVGTFGFIELAGAGDGGQCSPAGERSGRLSSVSVDELEKLMAAGKADAVDVNGKSVRKKLGVVKGALLLSHYSDFKAAELPSDKNRKLVFYCYNESCGASHAAAEKAADIGYKRVAVLPAGIVGWREAGKPTKAVR